jgi:hypothetical protein
VIFNLKYPVQRNWVFEKLNDTFDMHAFKDSFEEWGFQIL